MSSTSQAKLKGLIRDAEQEWRDRLAAGPSRLSWLRLPPQLGDDAPDLTLNDRDGRARPLSAFWHDGPALFVFWRHFGCGCGIERANRLRFEQSEFEAAGARVVVIGQGEPERATQYADEYDLNCTVLCDPDYEAYDAFGLLESGVPGIMYDAPEGVKALEPLAIDELVISRREEGRPLVDNPWMLPGEFVVDRKGKIAHVHRYDFCEDFPDPRVLTTAIERAVVTGEERL